MYMIEISETKLDKMAEYTEKMLRYGGRLMSCLSEIDEKYGERSEDDYSMRYGERSGGNRYGGSYGSRYDYGMRGGSMNYRDEEWDEDEEEMMHERRGGRRRRRDSRGRYM